MSDDLRLLIASAQSGLRSVEATADTLRRWQDVGAAGVQATCALAVSVQNLANSLDHLADALTTEEP